MNSKTAITLIFTVFIFSMFSANAAETHKSIPKIFQGKWISNIKDCGTDHETNLEISKNHISFYESSGPILSIVTKQKNELALIIELSGEGEEWLSFVHFKISENNNKLTDMKHKFTRYRCK